MCLLGCNNDSSSNTKNTGNAAKQAQSGSSSQPVATCPQSFVLRHRTIATQPADRSRTTIGIGEEVEIWTDPSMSVTWSIQGDNGRKGRLSTTSGARTTYTAHDRTVSATIEARNAQCNGSVTFSVVQLASSTLVSKRDLSKITATQVTVGFLGAPYGQPTNVSFYNVDTREGTCTATASGVFASDNGQVHADTGSWIPASGTVNSNGTYLTGDDEIRTGPHPRSRFPSGGTTDGRFHWPIPWRAQVRGGGVSGAYVYDTLHHLEEYTASSRLLRMSKGGESQQRTIP